MKKLITLVANLEKQALDDKIINKLFIKLEKKKVRIINLKWLSVNEACDIFIDSTLSLEILRQITQEVLEDAKIDYFVQNDDNRQKKLLISDMDSTIINQECIDEIAEKLNIKDAVATITESAMKGEIDFDQSLIQRVELIKGVTTCHLKEVAQNDLTLTKGARTLVQTMKKHGAKTVLVSGGFTFFTNIIANLVGFDENFANILEIENNRLSGKVIEPILDANSKLEIMNEQISILKINQDDVIAVGDGANDLMMLGSAGLGFAYYAKKAVIDKTHFHVNNTNLEALLFAQGFKREDFVN